METLFGQLDVPRAAPEKAEGPFAAVALEQGIDRLLDYSIPPRMRNVLRAGQVVRVPLGRKNRTTRGYVIAIHPTTEHPKIKPLSAIEDERVLIPPTRAPREGGAFRFGRLVHPVSAGVHPVLASASA